MPCMSYEDCGLGPDPRRLDEAKKEADKLTQMLCYLMGELTEDGIVGRYKNPSLEDWWRRHKEKDNERVLRKMREALSENNKLTAPALALKFIDAAEQVHEVSRYHKKWFLACAAKVRNGVEF